MKFIVDAQLPKAISDFITTKGFDSIHTLELPAKNKTTDKEITHISQIENRVVISKDNDFLESYLLKGEPRKLIIVRTGNISNADLILILEKNLEKLCQLLVDNSLIEIHKTEIVFHS